MTSLDELRTLLRQVTRLHLDTKDKPHVPEHVKSGLLTLQLQLGAHLERYLVRMTRAEENAREVACWFARMACKHWADDD